MKTAALIFDMDGTMIDSMPFHEKCCVVRRRHALRIVFEDAPSGIEAATTTNSPQ